jgi:hypothetical protein
MTQSQSGSTASIQRGGKRGFAVNQSSTAAPKAAGDAVITQKPNSTATYTESIGAGRKREASNSTNTSAAPQTTPQSASSNNAIKSQQELENDPQVQREVARLKRIEQKVKAHEAAHKAAGGPYTGAASYQYTTGPDGRRYIVGGEVSIDTSEAGSPQATITKMQIVQRAAMAPADPSPQDRAVAAAAAAKETKARSELREMKQKEQEEQDQKKAQQQNQDMTKNMYDRNSKYVMAALSTFSAIM